MFVLWQASGGFDLCLLTQLPGVNIIHTNPISQTRNHELTPHLNSALAAGDGERRPNGVMRQHF